MLRFGDTKVAKEKNYSAKKIKQIFGMLMLIMQVSQNQLKQSNSKYLIGYLDNVIRPLVLILPKTAENNDTFKVKDADKNKSNKLISFRIDAETLLEKYKTIQTNIEDLKNVELNTLQVYDDRYIKTKIKTYCDKVYNNFRAFNVHENDVTCRSFTVISNDSLHTYENNLQVYK